APVSTTSRASVVRPSGPMTSASTRISSLLRTKELEIFFIEDKRRPDQRDSGLAREPDGKPGVLGCEIADRLEGLVISGTMANDSGGDDLGAAERRMNDVDETDVLVRIARADLRARQWLGLE